MKKHRIISAIGLYILFLFIGHHGPFSTHQGDDHPHTHKKHVVKLLKTEEDLDQLVKMHRYVPLTT